MATVHDAARGGDVSALLTFLGANPLTINARDRHSRTPYPAKVTTLSHSRAPHARMHTKRSKIVSRLHLAAWAGQAEIVKILCEKRAEVGAAAVDDMAAIHFASQKGHLQALRHLLAAGAYVNACTRKGMTPLHFAVQGGYGDVVNLLMKKGARLDVQNKGGKTALDLAKDEQMYAALLALNSGMDAKTEEDTVLPMSKKCSTKDRSVDEEDLTKKRAPVDNVECTREKNVDDDLCTPKKKIKVELSHLADDQGGGSYSPEKQ